jgi:hypothetical protein
MPQPVYHITHWKAGSQWVRGVFEDACPHLFVYPSPAMQAGVIPDPAHPHAIYSPLYMPRWVFEATPAATQPHRKFIVIRDLRDTLISWYFSLRYTHAPDPVVNAHRERLSALCEPDGLEYLVSHADFAGLCSIPASWLDSGDLTIRYETLVESPHETFAQLFEYCRVDVSDERRHKAVDRWLFENMASRPRGQELRTSHMRKGIAGDWRNHFTPALTAAFKERYGDLLMRLGYEPDDGW